MHKHSGSVVDLTDPMRFFKKLQSITNKINATSKIEEIMLDLSDDICDLLGCDRLTLYALSESRTHIESKVKTGLRSFKHFSLPISEESVAGYVALAKKVVNIADVYNEDELRAISPGLKFMREVDLRTNYRTKQLLVAPLLNEDTGSMLGVVQLINNRADAPFSAMVEDGLIDLCGTLSKVFAQRMLPLLTVRLKYDPLVSAGVLSGPELGQAYRIARVNQRDIQLVLREEFHLRLADIGAGLSEFFSVPYEPFRVERHVPRQHLKKFKRAYAEHNRWLLLDESADGIKILSTDPARVRATRVVEHVFPSSAVSYFVTTDLEFRKTLDQYYGVEDSNQQSDLLQPVLTDVEQELLNKLRGIILQAVAEHAPEIRLELRDDIVRMVKRAHSDGKLAGIHGQATLEFEIDFP
jgi:hypothetical protein